MSKEFHAFPERTQKVMQQAADRRAAETPDPNTGRKPSAYKAAMEAKRARFNQGQGHGQAGATDKPPMPQSEMAPLMYDMGTAPRATIPSIQKPVDRSQPLGPQLMAAVREQGGLRSNLMADANLQRPQVEPEKVNHVTPPRDYVAPVADGRGTSISLPSHFAHYPFKDFYVLPIRGEQLEKFATAAETDSYVPVVEAVASLSYSTGNTGMVTFDSQGNEHVIPPAYFLTPQDFMNVLYHLRLHNFTRSKFIHTAFCKNQAHIDAVNRGELSQESLTIESFVDKTQLRVITLDAIPDVTQFQLKTEGLYLKPPQMLDVLEVLDMKPPTAGAAMLMDMACYFQASDGVYLGVEQRIDMLREMDLDDIEVIREYMASTNEAYGVDETINITCKECGASRKDQMSLDVHSFLPNQ